MKHNFAQSMASSFMGTNGSTCTMLMDTSYHLMCGVQQSLVPLSRLEEQDVVLTLKEGQPMMTRKKDFCTTLVKRNILYYFRRTVIPLPWNYTLQLQQAHQETIATDCTDNTRSRTRCLRRQWFLDVQQWRILGERTQTDEKSTILAMQNMSSSNRQVGEQYNCEKIWLDNTKTLNNFTTETSPKRTKSTTFTPTHRFPTKPPANTQLVPTSKPTTAILTPATL